MYDQPFDDRDGVIWMDGALVPWRDAKVHVLNHGLHYGGAVFEGERAYDGKIFKAREHAERLRTSAAELDFQIPLSVDDLLAAKEAVVQANGGGDLYIRPVAWRGSELLAIAALKASVHVAIAAWAWPEPFDIERTMQGIRIEVADYRRPDPLTAPSRAKAAGLYMISTISKQRAERRGYADALMLDWQGRVSECTGANVFFARGETLHTPIADCFLDGITRRTLIDIARARGMRVNERRILPDELGDFDECFVCGTGTEVMPVSEIGAHRYRPGHVCRAMIERYAAIVRS